MAPKAQTRTHVPDELLALLSRHLPYSLPLFRRLQFAKYKGGTTDDARTVVVSQVNPLGVMADEDHFTAVYVDFSGGPETQMWLFSTLETKDEVSEDEQKEHENLMGVLVQEMIRLGKEYGQETTYPGSVLLGTLDTRVRRILEGMDRVTPRATGYYDKWLFKASDVPAKDAQLPEGMSWDTACLRDCEVVVSRTDIPRTAQMLVKLPNLLIRIPDGTPISWAFLGADGSLISLHCEEPYRRRGLAKTLAAKLMLQGPGSFADDDGWCSADVAGDNLGSRGVCKSLNGKQHWEVSWVLFDVTEPRGKPENQ